MGPRLGSLRHRRVSGMGQTPRREPASRQGLEAGCPGLAGRPGVGAAQGGFGTGFLSRRLLALSFGGSHCPQATDEGW